MRLVNQPLNTQARKTEKQRQKGEGRWCRHHHDINAVFPYPWGRFVYEVVGEQVIAVHHGLSFLLTWELFLKRKLTAYHLLSRLDNISTDGLGKNKEVIESSTVTNIPE